MTTKCVEMRNITKKFRDFKLDNVSLEVPQGKIVGFIGENGAGKSTTINLLLNLIDKDSGEIEILGLHYPKDETKIKQQIGVAFDECFIPKNSHLMIWVSSCLEHIKNGTMNNIINFYKGFLFLKCKQFLPFPGE